MPKDHDSTNIEPGRSHRNAARTIMRREECTACELKEAANANFARRTRPETITRKTFEEAAKSIAALYNGSLCDLA